MTTPRESSESPTLLAVYGTLQRRGQAWHLLGPLVTGEPTPITLPGALYDTGRGYPALVLDDESAFPPENSPTAEKGVPAELAALRDPATALPVLDDYEGPEYKRVIITPTPSARCWVYTWIASVDGMAPLPNGWLSTTALLQDRAREPLHWPW